MKKNKYIIIIFFYCSIFLFSFFVLKIKDIKPDLIPVVKNFDDQPFPYQKYHVDDNNKICEEFYKKKFLFNCNLSKHETPSIILFGDSHANQYYNAFKNSLPSETIMSVWNASCFPFSTFSQVDYNCKNSIDSFKIFLNKNIQKETTIVLTGYFSYLASGFKYGNFPGRRVAAELNNSDRKKFIKSADDVLSFLNTKNYKIIIIQDIPDMVFSIGDCFQIQDRFINFIRYKKIFKKNCYIDRIEYETRNEKFNLLISDIIKKYPYFKIFDPKEILCDINNCYAIKNNYLLYYDSDHLSRFGSNLIVNEIINKNLF
jgi:hypothetical protein